MRTIEKTLYTFDELNDDAKENAREWWRREGLFDEWWDGVYMMANDAGELLGIDGEARGLRVSCSRDIREAWTAGDTITAQGVITAGASPYFKARTVQTTARAKR